MLLREPTIRPACSRPCSYPTCVLGGKTRRNFNWLGCIYVLGLLLKWCSDIMDEIVYATVLFNCVVENNWIFASLIAYTFCSSLAHVLVWGFLLQWYGKVGNWIAKFIRLRMGWYWCFLMAYASFVVFISARFEICRNCWRVINFRRH